MCAVSHMGVRASSIDRGASRAGLTFPTPWVDLVGVSDRVGRASTRARQHADFEAVLGLSWRSNAPVLSTETEETWMCPGARPVGFSYFLGGTRPDDKRCYTGTALVLHWSCTSTTPSCIGTSLVRHWHCKCTGLVLVWYWSGTRLVMRRQYIGPHWCQTGAAEALLAVY